MDDQDNNAKSAGYWFRFVLVMAVLVSGLWLWQKFLIPLAITFLLFILAMALVDNFRRLRVMGRPLPGWIAYVLSVATVIGTVLLFGWIVTSSADDVQAAAPAYQERLSELAVQIEAYLGPKLVDTARDALANVELANWAAVLANELASLLSSLGLVILYLIFLMSERQLWVEKIPRLVTIESDAKRTRRILDRVAAGVKQYMWVNAVTSAMSGLVAFAIFRWVGLDFASFLALIVFLVGFIPNIGAFIGIALSSLAALIQFDSLTPFLIVLVGYGSADQLISNLVQPSMQGKSLNLSKFMVVVSLTFWATLWGGIGAFLAVPMMVVAMVVCSEISSARWIAVLLSADGEIDDWDVEIPNLPTDER